MKGQIMNENLDKKSLAAPCGLYCGVCADNAISKECHGCGCKCGQCAGEWHSNHCDISMCVSSKNLESCADCEELSCTRLIQFTHDPIWTTHSVCIDNLRRRKKTGTEKWIAEQEEYFSDDNNRKKEILHHDKCAIRSSEWKK